MKKLLLIAILAYIGSLVFHTQGYCSDLPITQTLSEGTELRVPFDNTKIKKIVIDIQNLIDQESIIYRSAFIDGKERPENEIGPKFIRTHSLDPQITDKTQKIRPDRKTIVLDAGNMNEIYLKVEKGKVEVKISDEKKKM